MKITNRVTSSLMKWQFTEGRRARAIWVDGRPGSYRAESRLPRIDTVDVNRRLI